jgi:oligopeptide transport system substrate-binding protein
MFSKKLAWLALVALFLPMLAACGNESPPAPTAVSTVAATTVPTAMAQPTTAPTAAVGATATTGSVMEATAVTTPTEGVVIPPSGSFSWRAFAEPKSLDPGYMEETLSIDIAWQNMWDALTRFDPETNKILPALAESWDVSPNADIYTFHLRKDAKFTNGDPVTSADFVYSWNRAASIPDAPYVENVLSDIKGFSEMRASVISTDTTKTKITALSGLETPDPYTFKVTLTGPSAYFISQSALWTACVVNKKVVETGGEWYLKPGAGTGAYMLTEWKHNEQLTLKVNPDYYDQSRKASLDVIIPIIKDTSTAQSLFEKGQLSVLDQPDPESLDRLQKDATFSKQLFSTGQARSVWIGFNVTKPPFGPQNDEKAMKLRQAIYMGIDREQLVGLALSGAGQPITTLLPIGEPGYHAFDPYPFDIAKAKQMLADAGYPNGQGLDLTYTYRQRDVEKRVAENLQSQFKENLGLNIKIEGIEWATMLPARQDHQYTMFYGSWGHDFPDPQNWFTPLFHSKNIKGVGPGTGNDPGWSNAEYDRLVDEANKLADPAKAEDRLKLYYQAEEILLKEAPLVPLYQATRYWEIDTSKWSGYGTNPTGVYPFALVKAAK